MMRHPSAMGRVPRKSLPHSPSIVTLLVLVAFSGCATINPTDPFADTEAAHTRIRETPGVFDAEPEEQPTPSPVEPDALTLDASVMLALANNPELLEADADFVAAQAEVRIKRAGRLPTIRATGSYFHHLEGQRLGAPTAPGEPMYYTDDVVSADIVIRMPLYTGGRIINEFRAADLLAAAAGHALARTKEELVFNVTSAYYGILAQQKVVESAAFSQDVLTEHLARVERLVSAGKAAQVDALRTEVQLAEIEHQLLQEKNAYDIQRRLLANLMGVEGHSWRIISLADELAPNNLLSETEAVSIEGALARAYGQREDYLAALARLQAQAKQLDAARGTLEPDIMFEAAYGGRWGVGGSSESSSSSPPSVSLNAAGDPTLSWTSPYPGGGSINTVLGAQGLTSQRFTPSSGESADDFRDSGRVGLVVDIPVFEGGRLRAQIDKERARLRAEQQRLRRIELQIQLEVETAALNLESARKRVEVSAKSVAEAEESLDIERRKYDLGKGAIVDVLDAQEALLTNQTNRLRALADYHTAQAQLELATGDQMP